MARSTLYQQQLTVEDYCQGAFASYMQPIVGDAPHVTMTSCTLLQQPTMHPNQNGLAAVMLPINPELRTEVYYLFRSCDLTPQQLRDEFVSILQHNYTSAFGVALETKADRDVVLRSLRKQCPIYVTCVAEGGGGNDEETPHRWCILRFRPAKERSRGEGQSLGNVDYDDAEHDKERSCAATVDTAQPESVTIADALAIPDAIRGSDLKVTLANRGEHQSHTILSLVQMIEGSLVSSLCTHRVAVVPLLPVRFVITSPTIAQDVGQGGHLLDICAFVEHHRVDVAPLLLDGLSPSSAPSTQPPALVVAPSMRPHAAPLVPLAAARLCDALHWRHVCRSAAAQQIIVLVVTAREPSEEGRHEENIPGEATAMWRGPRDRLSGIPLLDAQHEELRKAQSMLQIVAPCGSLAAATIPQRILEQTIFLHVSLSELACSNQEREAILNPQGGVVNAGGHSQQQPLCSNKKLVWRNLMSLFAPAVTQFLTTVSYPCVVVSSPATIVDAVHQTYHALVIPRSLGTMRSRTQPDCLFRADDVALAMRLFYQHLLCTDARDARQGAGEASPLKRREETADSSSLDLTAARRSGHQPPTSATVAQGDVAEALPCTWFPV
jgi:hypothetical protein